MTITTPLRRSRSASAKGSPIVTTEQPSQTNENDSNCETVEVDLFDDLLGEVVEGALHQAVGEITPRFQDDWGNNSMSWDGPTKYDNGLQWTTMDYNRLQWTTMAFKADRSDPNLAI